MTTGVKFHTAGRHLVHIQIRINNCFLIPDRLSNIMSVRINHTAAAAADKLRQLSDFILRMQISRIHIFSKELIAVNVIAASFERNMLNSSLPLRIIIVLQEIKIVTPFWYKATRANGM